MYGQQFTPNSRTLSFGGGDQDEGASEEGLGASGEGRRAMLEETAGEGEDAPKELSLVEEGGDSTEEVEEGGDSTEEVEEG